MVDKAFKSISSERECVHAVMEIVHLVNAINFMPNLFIPNFVDMLFNHSKRGDC